MFLTHAMWSPPSGKEKLLKLSLKFIIYSNKEVKMSQKVPYQNCIYALGVSCQ